MKKVDKLESQKELRVFLYMLCTHVSEPKQKDLLCTSATTLPTKPKQQFASSVLCMRSTHANEKKKTPQPSLQTEPKTKVRVLSMWLAHVSEKNRTTLDLHNYQTPMTKNTKENKGM